MLLFWVLLTIPLQSEAIDWGCPYSEPVCGTDGKTYEDICEFNKAKISDQDLQVLYEDRCLDHRMLKRPTQLKFQNIGLQYKWKLDKNSKLNSKNYILHFRTLPKESNKISLLDKCPRKCKTVCPRNKQELRNTLHFIKSNKKTKSTKCLDCCNYW